VGVVVKFLGGIERRSLRSESSPAYIGKSHSMARNKSSKPNPGSVQSSTLIGFDLSAAKDIMVALPGQLFDCMHSRLSLVPHEKQNADAKRSFRDRVEMEVELALTA